MIFMVKQRDFKISPSRGLKIQETISNELIGRYRQLLMSQLYSWFDEGDGNVVYRAVTKLLKKGVFTIVPDPKDQGRELIKAAFYSQVLDKEMLAAFWALIFLRNIKANDDVALVTHYPDKGDTCAKSVPSLKILMWKHRFYIVNRDLRIEIMRQFSLMNRMKKSIFQIGL